MIGKEEGVIMCDFSQGKTVATLHNFDTKTTAELEADLKLFSVIGPWS